MSYRNKVYACFDGDYDIRYYRLLTAWHANDSFDFDYHDAHSISQARDTSSEQTIKRSLRMRLANTKVMLVLIGENTKNLFRFVRWEMEVALEMNIPIIAVNLNKSRRCDENLCPPILKNEPVVHIGFEAKIISHALKNWPEYYKTLQSANRGSKYYYNDNHY